MRWNRKRREPESTPWFEPVESPKFEPLVYTPPGNFTISVKPVGQDPVTYEAVDEYVVGRATLELTMGNHILYYSYINVEWFDVYVRNKNGS